jgi:hypothetical protein
MLLLLKQFSVEMNIFLKDQIEINLMMVGLFAKIINPNIG